MVADGLLLDYETADRHSVVVQVTDAGGLGATASFSIAVQFDDSGNDWANSVGLADDVIDSGPGDDQMEGGDGNDILNGGRRRRFSQRRHRRRSQVSGSAGADMLFGDDGDDWLIGGDSGTVCMAVWVATAWMVARRRQPDRRTRRRRPEQRRGADSLFGSLGNDVLRGGAGNDTLSGGAGADRFVFDALGAGVDVIRDFGTGDVLAVGNLLERFRPRAGADFVRLSVTGTNTTVQLDVDGAANGSAYQDLAVLTGVTGTTLASLVNAGQVDFLIA